MIQMFFRGDFSMAETFHEIQEGNSVQVDVPEHVRIEYFTRSRAGILVAERNGESCTNCRVLPDGKTLLVSIPLSRKCIGKGEMLKIVTVISQDDAFPDSRKEESCPGLTGVVLTEGASDNSSVVPGEAVLSSLMYGYSAYQLAVIHGYQGTEVEWVAEYAAAVAAARAAAAAIPFETGTGNHSAIQKGGSNTASGNFSVAHGQESIASGGGSHAEGKSTASGDYSHSEGYRSEAGSNEAHAEGYRTVAAGVASHAEGYYSKASGQGAHAEGRGNEAHTSGLASGDNSHVEGMYCVASGNNSHAEGYQTQSPAERAHSEGSGSVASGVASHAEGKNTTTSNEGEHAEGRFNVSHQKNDGTSAQNKAGSTLSSVGAGTATGNRLNAREIMQNGDHYILGVGGYDGTNAGAQGIKPLQKVLDDGMPFVKDEAIPSSIKRTEGYNDTVSEYNSNRGVDGTSGRKGLYWSAINLTTRVITLSSSQDSQVNVDASAFFEVGDDISIVDFAHYEKCSKVTAVSGSTITVDSLPFTAIESGYEPAADSRSVYCPDKNTGLVDFGKYATTDGYRNKALGTASFAEGFNNVASGSYSHVEGRGNYAAYGSHAEGIRNEILGRGSHGEGYENKMTPKAKYSHVEGAENLVSGDAAHSEGWKNTSSGSQSHTEGKNNIASGEYSHAEGYGNEATGMASHAEGEGTVASGGLSHAEGYGTEASGLRSHAEGMQSKSTSNYTHSEGYQTLASEYNAHAEGMQTEASGVASHAEGRSTAARGRATHAEGEGTLSQNQGEHAEGMFNKSNKKNTVYGSAGNTQHSVGIGTSDNNRKNAFEVMQNGDVYILGLGGYDGTNAGQAGVKTIQQLLLQQ